MPGKSVMVAIRILASGALLLNMACPNAISDEGACAAVASWPRFRGLYGDGRSRETGLLKSWPQGGPELLWMAEGIGEGYSSVSVAAGRIYTAGNLRDQTAVTALDLEGNMLWQASGGEAWEGPYPGTRGTPTVDGQRVYHLSPLGRIVCLDAQDGREVWSLNIVDELGARLPEWGLAESLLIDGNRLICCPGGEHASVVALHKETGQLLWAAEPTGDLAAYASPIVVEHQGLRIILAMSQNGLIGIGADDGRLLFRHAHQTRFDAHSNTPLFHDGRIFISSGYGSGSQMLRLRVDGRNASVARLWQSADLDILHGGAVLVGGHLYGAAHQSPRARQGVWLCVDGATGETRHAARGAGMGSIIYADGMLYTLSERGDVWLVPAEPGSHVPAGRLRLPGRIEGPAWAHPVICGGVLYIRHGNRLFAYDI